MKPIVRFDVSRRICGGPWAKYRSCVTESDAWGSAAELGVRGEVKIERVTRELLEKCEINP